MEMRNLKYVGIRNEFLCNMLKAFQKYINQKVSCNDNMSYI